jgi:hypothetical protein
MPRPNSISNSPAARAWRAENKRTSTSSALKNAEVLVKKLKRPVVSYDGKERTITKLTDEFVDESVAEMNDPDFSLEKMNAIKMHRDLFKYHDEKFHSPANSQSEFPHIHGHIAADHAKKFYNLTRGERLKSVSGAMHPPPEFRIEMIDPALAITGAIVAGAAGGYALNKGRKLLDRLRMALKSPAEKDKTRNQEIERAQQAAKKPVKMPPMRFGPKK